MKRIAFIMLVALMSGLGCGRRQTASDFQTGLFEPDVNTIYLPKIPSILSESEGIKIVVYDLKKETWGESGITYPYFFIFVRKQLSEDQLADFAKRADIADQSDLDYVRRLASGKFFLYKKTSRQASIDHKAIQKAISSNAIFTDILKARRTLSEGN